MTAISGMYKNGTVILDQPADWPEGCAVRVEPSFPEQADDPETITKWIAEFDAIPPWEFTPAEEADWQAARKAVKDYTLAKMAARFPEGLP